MLAFWICSNKSAGAWMWLNYMLLSWMAYVHSPSVMVKTWAQLFEKWITVFTPGIHRINLYPVDNAIDFPNTYPLDSDISGE